jgi:hypothetical protein
VINITAFQDTSCVTMRWYEEGEAHPAVVGVSFCESGRLLRPAHGGNAFDELLCIDAVQSRQPVAGLLQPGSARVGKSSPADR